MKRDSTQRIRRAAIRLAAAVLLSLVVYGLLQIPARQPGYAAAAGPAAVVFRDGKPVLVNNADGYCLPLAEGAAVDFSRAEAGVSVTWPDRTLDIYVEPLNGIRAATYIDYSKRFLKEDPVHHVLDKKYAEPLPGGMLAVTAWHRQRLSRVENDHHYYTCLDIVRSARVYTLLLKTDCAVSRAEVEALRAGLICYRPTAAAAPVQIGGGSGPKNEEALALCDAMFGDGADFTWGFYSPDAPYTLSTVRQIEERLDCKFRFLMMYSDLKPVYDPDAVAVPLQTAWDDGRIVMLTLQAQSAAEVYGVLDGEYDGFLREYAKAVADFGHPVLLRLFNEMNGDWCGYNGRNTSMDPSLFRALYSYVTGFFREAGADNILWVWNPNERAYPQFRWNHMSMYYPDEGCDLYGITGYNTGTYYTGEAWRSFEAIYAPILADAEMRCSCPILITEFSCSDFGGDKAAWITDMFAHIEEYPRLCAAVWWNGTDYAADGTVARQYRIDHNEDYLSAFRAGLSRQRRTGGSPP